MGSIRLAVPEDAAALLDIYRPYIEESPVTMETEVPSADEFRSRMEAVMPHYPYLVHTTGGVPDGYAYASRHQERAGYRWNTYTSVYLRQDCRGRGIGTRLYALLLETLAAQGFFTAYAAVTLPNPASLSLHKRFGFAETGIFRRCGYKFGRWHDIIWLEKRFREDGIPPETILPPGAVLRLGNEGSE